MNIKADVGIILRCDNILKEHKFKKIIVNTPSGKVDRVYYGKIQNTKVIVLYGRFKGNRTPSYLIDYEQNQQVFDELEVKTIVGSFIVGAISAKHHAGEIFFPNDYVGLGNFQHNLSCNENFKNVDMYQPFCKNLRNNLLRAADQLNINYKEGIYVSFTGYPRIETKAELDFYEKNGWDIIGQTLDVEATLAKQANCHYAAICALTDDIELRKLFTINSLRARELINIAKIDGRQKMEKILHNWLTVSKTLVQEECPCSYEYQNEYNFFRSQPSFD